MRKTLVLGALLGLVLAQVAAAHVEATPDKIKAGAGAKVTFNVPAEEKVPAIKFAVELPASLTDVALQPTAGWEQALNGRVATWSRGQIPPGKSAHFSLTARWPDTPGKTLIFPSVETYAGGKVVHWIGPESAEFPAARVTLTGVPKSPPVTVPSIATGHTDNSSSSNTWIWVVVAAAALGLLGLAVFFWRRRA
jgi:periplasmic copper chaperone A